MEKKDIREILKRYREGKCTDEEITLLESWVTTGLLEENQLSEKELEEELTLITKDLPLAPIERSLWPRIAAVASVIIIFSIGGYFLLHRQREQLISNINRADISPGSNKAILILSNGKKISLADVKSGTIANDLHALIKKSDDGTISYQDEKASKIDKLVYNTIETPKGGQWSLVLPDGSKVMLDAFSSIKYPVTFNGNERKVEITGQVYFEVVHNNAQPFKITVKGQTITDIGTHFNVNAYDDEPAIITTLAEGSVKVSQGGQNAILKPGQETLSSYNNNKLIVRKANLQQVLAWKNGLFFFDQTNLKTLMRQVSRWYDFEVIYEDNIPNDEFDGQISRNVTLSQLLKILHSNDVHYRIENIGTTKRLIIKP